MYVSAEDEKIESYELRDSIMLMAVIQSLERFSAAARFKSNKD